MKSLIQFKRPTLLLFVPLALAFFAPSPAAQAVVPPPDGGYPNFTTAEGANALKNLTSGAGNTAFCWYSLFSTSTANFNTAVGAGTLALNTGEQNTAVGTGALLFNTTGVQNTANGIASLINNDNGSFNTAEGDQTLLNNTIGGSNTAIGDVALYYNTSGSGNTAIGAQALTSNTTGNYNTALGFAAGGFLTTGDNNIDIGHNVLAVAGESNTIRIGNDTNSDTYITGISGATTSGGAAVFVDALGKLGTTTSSARFKRDIQPMGSASEAILALKPVCFRYKKELDPKGLP